MNGFESRNQPYNFVWAERMRDCFVSLFTAVELSETAFSAQEQQLNCFRLATAIFCLGFPGTVFGQAEDWLPTIPVGTMEVKLDPHSAGFNGNVLGVDQILPSKMVAIPDGSGRMPRANPEIPGTAKVAGPPNGVRIRPPEPMATLSRLPRRSKVKSSAAGT